MSLVLNSTSGGSVTIQEPTTASNFTQTLAAATGTLAPLVSGTAVTASGTAVNFTGIPAYAKRITVMFSGVSTNGTSNYLIQLGDAGGIENTGYISVGTFLGATTGAANYTAGFGFIIGSATHVAQGKVDITLLTSNTWVANGGLAGSGTAAGFRYETSGNKTLSDTLTQVRITTVNGTDTFDAGTINIMWE